MQKTNQKSNFHLSKGTLLCRVPLAPCRAGNKPAFTKVFTAQTKRYGQTRDAVRETLRICKEQNLLKQYLTEHEKEVVDIMSLLFSQEEVTEMYVREREEEAMKQGRMEGFASGQKEGFASGQKQGFASGQKQGFASGQKEGEKKNAIETAERMLREALPTDLIVRVSGLSLSEIEKIKEQMKTESSN